MHDLLRDRLMRKLETLPEERVYQVLDYVEFLESKYARTPPAATVFQRFADGVEDTMRAGKLSAQTIGETMNLMSKAMGVLSGAMAAGKSVASDVVTAARAAQQQASAPVPPQQQVQSQAQSSRPTPPQPSAGPAAGPTAGPSAPAPEPPPSPTAHPTPAPSTTGETPA